MKVALVYDRVNKWGGAERVLLALHQLFPNAPLFTSVYNKKNTPWADRFAVQTSFLQGFPYASMSHEYLAPFMSLAFESFSFDEFDLIISISSEAAKGIVTKPSTKHLCYCLTPTRYLWSGYNDYFPNAFIKIATYPLIAYLRSWDTIAAHRPDKYIAISKEVQKRIKMYYARESDILYPPLMLDNLSTDTNVSSSGYFLVVSRLVPYKRIDIAIDACNRLQLPLKIVGIGSQESYLRKIAGSTITFAGNLTDQELVGYYKGCTALLFPGNEDLGLAMVEAQSLGKPIIAYKAGGALEIIKEGKSGEFFSSQNSESLIALLREFNPEKYTIHDCKKQAEKFSFETFKKEFTKAINEFI